MDSYDETPLRMRARIRELKNKVDTTAIVQADKAVPATRKGQLQKVLQMEFLVCI